MATNILAIVVIEAHAFVLRSPFPHFRISPFPISYFPVPGFSTTPGHVMVKNTISDVTCKTPPLPRKPLFLGLFAAHSTQIPCTSELLNEG